MAVIFRRHGDAYRRAHDGHLGRVERRVMSAIELCRTAALGSHVEACSECGLVRCAYNSCRSRRCPKCQGAARAEWLAARQAGRASGSRCAPTATIARPRCSTSAAPRGCAFCSAPRRPRRCAVTSWRWSRAPPRCAARRPTRRSGGASRSSTTAPPAGATSSVSSPASRPGPTASITTGPPARVFQQGSYGAIW